jgi:hypothetical protein
MPRGRPRKTGPRPECLPEATQIVIALYLTHIRESAIRAIQSQETVLAQAPHLPGAMGDLDYWRRIAQACDYAMHRLPQKQQWLVGVQSQDPFDSIMEGVTWSRVQSICGVTYIPADPSPSSATEEQSQSTSQPTEQPKASPAENPEQQSRPSNGRGKGSAKRSYRRSSDSLAG